MNWIERIAKILRDNVVLTVNGQRPVKGNADLSYMARQDKSNTFSQPQVMAGGITRIAIPDSSDLDTYDKPGFYDQINDLWVHSSANVPFSNSYYMDVLTHGLYVLQVAYRYDGLETAIRMRDSNKNWQMWVRYVTQENVVMLKGNLADGTDIHTITQTGIYGVSGVHVSNGPSGSGDPTAVRYAQLTVIALAGFVTQTWVNSDGSMYVAKFGGSPSVWSSWQKFTMVAQ